MTKKWEVVGYYLDGTTSWTILSDAYGKTKMIRGIK